MRASDFSPNLIHLRANLTLTNLNQFGTNFGPGIILGEILKLYNLNPLNA